MITGTINVVTPGTAVVCPKAGTVSQILWIARAANADTIYLGSSDVSSTDGISLEPGQAITIPFARYGSLKDWYADADTAADKVDFYGDNSG